ncbi:hypothetical protein BGZ51_000685 [Haplosporangium sp. Z 767]|nr:hypothetical protein BGZ50_004920 [Haplosporangium sp. Z 11]KAF9188289.1 hypothetical protein BGZ51_000685 [Haplosporangium sp. Z 767]
MSSPSPPSVPSQQPQPTPAPTTSTATSSAPPASTTSSAVVPPAPTVDPGPNPPNPSNPSNPSNPTDSTSSATSTTTKKGRPAPTKATGTPSNGIDPAPTNNPEDNEDGTGKKSIVGPVVGGIAGVLVLAFLIAVFVMRYKKKNGARKRRLEFLGDHDNGAGSDDPAVPPAATQSASGASPATASRPLEMAAISGGAGAAATAAAAHHRPNNHNDGYDYQQGYQQVPYGGYPDQHDQYDPYYAQRQQQQQYQQQQYQQQGYYPDQQGYYADENQYQNQYAAPVPLPHTSQTTGSPSMTYATASPTSYPQPPSITTGGHSSPRTPLQSVPVPAVPDMSYDKNAKVESGYVGVHSTARNPQLIPQPDEGIKVPI